MLWTWDIISGGERIAVREAATPLLALIEHLRLAGCDDRDVVRLGPSAVAWRGAVYRAERTQVGAREPEFSLALRGD